MPDSNVVEHVGNDYRRESGRRAPPSRLRLGFWFGLIAVLLALVSGAFYVFERVREQKTAEFFAHFAPPPPAVAIATAESEPWPQFLAGIGTIYAVHQVTVAPEVGGRVTQIFFQSGATVRAGDPLVQLNDQPDQGDLLNFRAQARLAQINLTRAKELASRGNGPVANVDLYQSQLDQANAMIAKTQAIIAQKLVRAPFSGVLGIRQVDLGQYVNAGMPIVTLTDLDTLYADFTLPEQSRAALSVGQPVEIAVDAYPKRRFTGKLTTIEPQVSADTRTIKLQATLANPEHLLQPGMFVNARVVLPPQPDVVTVPETAVDYSLYGNAVYLVEDGKDKDGKPILTVKRTFVETGEKRDNKVAILQGLKAGDRVASSGQLKLHDGMTVVAAETNSLTTPAAVPRP
ncbi:MAG TPA: efflux RND transporter periplasmic adaptor subunit [Stellaceae bacterium]|nr:efflux RND transporter periplasmic adaptor subunit [Stellaceae bacterium]